MSDHQSFDLEKHITQWRNDLRSRKWFNDSQLAELQDHLEMAVKQHVALGKDELEAFNLAINDLGDTRDIAKEFFKLNWLNQVVDVFTEFTVIRRIVAIFLIFGAWELLLKLSFMIGSGYNKEVAIVALVVFLPIMIWTRSAGVALWQGKSVNYTGLFLFYLLQVPVFGFAAFNYEFYYGISFLVQLGYVDSLYDFAFLGSQQRGLIDMTLSSNLHLNTPFDKNWFRGEYLAINLYALFVSIFCISHLIKKHKHSEFDQPIIVGSNQTYDEKYCNALEFRQGKSLIRRPLKTFKWLH